MSATWVNTNRACTVLVNSSKGSNQLRTSTQSRQRNKLTVCQKSSLLATFVGGCRRWFIDQRPKKAKLFHAILELPEVNRLDHIGIDAQFIAFDQVPLFP